MGMSRCYSLMKCLLILFNIIFLVVGLGVCGAACWALYDGRAGETAAGRAALGALAVWAAALAAAALAALAGAARHSASLLAASFALLSLTGVAGGAAAWWGAAHGPQLRAALEARLRHTLAVDYGVLPARTHALDAIQMGLKCCGADSARDWQNSAWGAQQAAAGVGAGAAGEAGAGAGAGGAGARADARTLDLSVGAPPAFYWVPASCCETADPVECEASRLVAAASGGARGLHAAPCAPRVLAALAEHARAPLLAAAALLAAHAAALLLALALCLRARPPHHYKA